MISLHYSTDTSPGYRRIQIQNGFAYKRDCESRVTDLATLKRLNALVIPPAYTKVWISADPLAHLQARARDSKMRPQYRYHELWTEQVRTGSKFSRMQAFGSSTSKLRRLVDLDLNKKITDRDSQAAAVIRLFEVSGIRIGGQKYADHARTFGLTTLQVRHVKIQGSQIRFQFVAKENIYQDILVKDLAVARVLSEVLKTKKSKQSVFDVTASNVNDYI